MSEKTTQLTQSQAARLWLEHPDQLAQKFAHLEVLEHPQIFKALEVLYLQWSATYGSRYDAMRMLLLGRYEELREIFEDESDVLSVINTAIMYLTSAVSEQERQKLAEQISRAANEVALPENSSHTQSTLIATALRVVMSQRLDRTEQSLKLDEEASTRRLHQAHQQHLAFTQAYKEMHLTEQDSYLSAAGSMDVLRYYRVVLPVIKAFVESIPIEKPVTASMIAQHLNKDGIQRKYGGKYKRADVRTLLQSSDNLDWLRSHQEARQPALERAMAFLDGFPYKSEEETNQAVVFVQNFLQTTVKEEKSEIRQHPNYWYTLKNYQAKKEFPDHIKDFLSTYFLLEDQPHEVPQNLFNLVKYMLMQSENNGILSQDDLAKEIGAEITKIFELFFHPTLSRSNYIRVLKLIERGGLSAFVRVSARHSAEVYTPKESDAVIPVEEIIRILKENNQNYSTVAHILNTKYGTELSGDQLRMAVNSWNRRES